jgi:flagellar secretion chaperone FliS
MDKRLRNFYLESQVNNASPGQLLIMLYDGLIQHAERADMEISSTENALDFRAGAQAITRCIDILTELNTCLKHGVDPVLCGTLSDLYLFFTREFSEAFDKRQPKKIRVILPLLRELRNTWFEADRRANQFQVLAA